MPATIAFAAALTLSACSGDGGDDPQSQASPSSASESPTIYPIDGCEADVKVTGAVKVAWEGNGQVSDSGEASSLYQSKDGKKSWIAVTASTGDAPSRVVVTVNGTTYRASGKHLRVKEGSDGVTVTATAPINESGTARVNATFVCTEQAG